MSQKYRIYPNKEATIASGTLYENLNSSQETAFNLWYGGGGTDTALARRNSISRHIAYFDLSELQAKYADYTYNSAYTVSYTLKYTNCIPSDKILEPEYEFNVLNKSVATSFDLVFFPIEKSWDEGRGGALDNERLVTFKNFSPILTGVTNWLSATTLVSWDVPGIYTNPTAETSNYVTQHFELGAENISVDITSMVNDWLSAGTNNGVGIAYVRPFELLSTDTRYVSSFYTNKTNSAFKPYLEVSFSDASVIKDDRHWVTNNRRSRLYLYTFSGNTAANYFSANTVFIKNSANVIVHSGLVPVHQSKGVYYVDVFMSGTTKGQKYRDVWSGVTFAPGYDQQDITQSFDIRDNFFGTNAYKTNDYALDIYGLNNNAPLVSGEIHRIYADVRVGYSNARPSTDFGLEYKITMGLDEVHSWAPMNSAIIDDALTCFFDLDTSWLLNSQIYTIEFRIAEFGTKRLLPNKLTFSVMNAI